MPLTDKHTDTKTYDDILNAGPPVSRLAKEFLTPTELFFVRNHASIPKVNLDSYRLRGAWPGFQNPVAKPRRHQKQL